MPRVLAHHHRMPGATFAAGQVASTPAAALAREMLRAMSLHKLRFTAMALLLPGAVAVAAGHVTRAPAMSEQPGSSPIGQPPPIAPRPDDGPRSPATGRMFVVGRVLDPTGKPVPRATILVYARNLAPAPAPYSGIRPPIPIGDARADGSGRFRVDVPRTSSSSHDAFGAVALAPGYGAGWVKLDSDDDQPTADITLRPEQVIHGRLFDFQGQPAPGVTLSVWLIQPGLPRAPAEARILTDAVVFLSGTAVNDLPGWPRPVITDTEGRFTLRGLGRDLHVGLHAHHPRFAFQRILFEAKDVSESKPLSAALAPAQILNVRVTYADTGEPVPHAPLRVVASQGNAGLVTDFETDARGRARVNGYPADRWCAVWAYPPDGQPYLTAHNSIQWPRGAVEQSLDLALPRGVSIRGKVTEAGSGKPVPGAIVDYFSRGKVPGTAKSVCVATRTASDGSFHLGVEPIPGCLFVRGPGDDYVFRAIDHRKVNEGQPGGARIYAHAHALLDLRPDIGDQEVNLVLRRGATATGRVIGPDGRPVRHAWIFSRIILNPRQGAWALWVGRHHGIVHNGRFEIHGLDPDAEVPVSFLDPEHKLGAVVNLSGKSAAGGPITVRLEPCGAAGARVVDPAGKPVTARLPGEVLGIRMLVTPGRDFVPAKDTTSLLIADHDDLDAVDPAHYKKELIPEADGRITLPVLIPGATYRLVDRTTIVRGEAGPAIRKEFTVKPGETADLGEIRIEKPPR